MDRLEPPGVEPVEALLPRLAHGHELDLAQYAQMLGDARLGDAERPRQLVHRALPPLEQGEDAPALRLGWILAPATLAPASTVTTQGRDAASAATVTIVATSEADPSATQTITVQLSGQGEEGPQESALSLSVLGKGSKRTLVARLTSAADPNAALSGRSIDFYAADGTFLGRATTDGDGIASVLLSKSYRASNQQFLAEFGGDAEWLAASATAGG